jgi:hypothetical protein
MSSQDFLLQLPQVFIVGLMADEFITYVLYIEYSKVDH